ncbi:retrotransposon protein, putative, ty1-copia subclass [Tanacetum coccineum]
MRGDSNRGATRRNVNVIGILLDGIWNLQTIRPIKKLLNAKGKNKVNGKGKDKKVYIPKPNNPKSTAMERPAKDDACHHCKEEIRSDRGGEYISQEFKDYLKANGIVQQLTPPYTPQHNGVSERRNRTLLDMVRSMMNLTTLPLSFWDYALESATRILNMVPTKKVDKTPYELWYGKVPTCLTKGYPKETMGYYFYFPPENKIVVARYAEFFEKRLISQEISGRAVDLEEIQEEEDTTPSEITSNIPQEVEEVEEHSLGDLNEPTSYKAAMLDSESNKWIDAMNAEIQSMMDNIAWVLSSSSCSRLVAKGYTQLYGVDYEETFSPVADIRAIRILISIAHTYIMRYVKWIKVCKLQRSIYGLKKRQEAGIKDLMKKSKDMFLVYGGNPSTKLRVECYCDAGFETDRDTLVVDRYVSLMNGGAVDWKSSKQSTTAMSATESEYIAASESCLD